MAQRIDCKTSSLNISTATDTTIATPGSSPCNIGGTGVGSIFVWQMDLNAGAAQTIQPKSNTTAIGGLITFAGAGVQNLPYTGVPYYKTAAGQALVLTTSTTGATTGTIYYTCE